MSTHEKIISLLQGDLRDQAQVAALINELAISSENQRLLLDYIRLNQQIDQFVEKIVPVPIVKNKIWTQIEEFEKNKNTVNASKKRREVPRLNQVILLTVLAFFSGLGVGSWYNGNNKIVKYNSPTTTGNTISTEATRSELKDLQKQSIDSSDKHNVQYAVKYDYLNLLKNYSLNNSVKNEIQSFDVISPNGGEVFKTGSTIPIAWFTTNDSGLFRGVELSMDGGVSWGEIGQDDKSSKMLWSVPEGLDSSTRCLVRIISEDSAGISPQLMRTFVGHDSAVTVAEISPDGRWLATVSSDSKILLWNMETGQLKYSMIGHTASVTFAKFNRDGTKLVSCSQDGTARIWNVETGKEEHVLMAQGGEKKVVWAAAFNPNSSIVAVTNDDGSVNFWDVNSGDEIKRSGVDGVSDFRPHDQSVRYVEYSIDGDFMIASSVDKTATIIDAHNYKVVHSFVHHIDDVLQPNATREERREALRRCTVNGVQITPDGKILITAGFDGLVKFWNTETGNLIRSAEYHSGKKVSSIVLSSDGKLLASVGYDGTAKIIETSSGRVIASIASPMNGQDGPMVRASFSRDMRFLAIAHVDGRATIWRLRPVVSSDISNSFWSIEPCESLAPKME